MKVKFSALVSEMRGKLNGSVASRNRGGAYLRNKVTPLNPQTSFQGAQRQSLTTLSQAWRGLTDAQRAEWRAMASEYVGTDIFGDAKEPTGFNLFIKLNKFRLQIGEAMLTSPLLPKDVPSVNIEDFTVNDDAELEVTLEQAATPADAHTLVSATPQQSAGKNFVRSEFRLIGVIEPSESSPIDISEMWSERFGEEPEVGAKVFVELRTVRTETGQPGSRVQASAVVTEAPA